MIEKKDMVINQIKAPLNKAIISAASKFANQFGDVTKLNTCSPTTHSLIDIRDKFLSYDSNGGRRKLFEAIINLGIAVFENSNYYRFRFDWAVEEIVKSILEGKWESRPLNAMEKFCWSEPEPNGGEYSIVYKMIQHKDEIKRILGI